jgi:hypothetical protein
MDRNRELQLKVPRFRLRLMAASIAASKFLQEITRHLLYSIALISSVTNNNH